MAEQQSPVPSGDSAGQAAGATAGARAGATGPKRFRITTLIVAGLFALLFAYNLWEALGSLIAYQQVFAASGLVLPPSLWILMGAVLLLPLVAWAAGLLLSQRQPAWVAALLFAAALAANEALALGITALIIDPTQR